MLRLDAALCAVLILGLLNGIYSKKSGKYASEAKIMIHDCVMTYDVSPFDGFAFG